MAITNAQQFKQLLQDGGMLVKPRDDGKRPGYRNEHGGGGQYGGGNGNKGGGDGNDGRNPMAQFSRTAPEPNAPPSDKGRQGIKDMRAGLRSAISAQNRSAAFGDFKKGLKNIFDKTLIGKAINTLGKLGPNKGFSTQGSPYGNAPGGMRDYSNTEDDDEQGQGDGAPLYAQLGFPSQEAYLASLAAQGSGTMDQEPVVEEEKPFEFYRRFRADGGIMNTDVVGGEMDFESARQMYGLGKLVKKITRSVKKVAKSPIGKAAIGYALTGGLGNLAQGQGFFTNFARPTSFLGGAKNIFSRQGLKNILVGGKNFYGERAQDFTPFSGIFGKGGQLSPLKAIAGVSAVAGMLTPQQEEEAQQVSEETGIDIAEIRANPNKYLARRFRAGGGIMRTNYANGSEDTENTEDLSDDPNYKGWVKIYEVNPDAAMMNEKANQYLQFYNRKAEGGSMKEPVAKKVMPLLDMDGKEKDYRETGGFVDMGRMEKADDVPARLSKNEFVFTADAVRNAGDGSVDKGAEVMYNMMKNLESGGDVSEESQGLEGARKMFQTSQRLEEVL